MLPSPRGSQDELVRDALLSTSNRLQILWEEAAHEGLVSSETPDGRRCWDTAAQRLVDAMEGMERLAQTLEPSLGRRDWRARCNGVGALLSARRRAAD